MGVSEYDIELPNSCINSVINNSGIFKKDSGSLKRSVYILHDIISTFIIIHFSKTCNIMIYNITYIITLIDVLILSLFLMSKVSHNVLLHSQ